MGKKIRITLDVTELGRAGGHARAAALTDDQLSAAGRNAVNARWDAYYKAHPEKLSAKAAKGKKAGK
jgi:hypothetical protein